MRRFGRAFPTLAAAVALALTRLPCCSRLALSLGVAEWIFALPDGLVGYSSVDYDAIGQLRW